VARLHREIVDALMNRIVDGRDAPGTRLPKEELLVEEFDVSRGTVREALRALEERRVAIVKHGRGATVQPPEEWNVLDGAVAGALVLGRRRRAFLREVAELRELLEPEAAALAAERASAAQRTAIRSAGEALAAGGTARALWRLVAVATGNRPLASTLRALSDMHEPKLTAEAAGACRALATAVADGDADAARGAASS
jgi:DNA-binding FadR family transcriptional regulator